MRGREGRFDDDVRPALPRRAHLLIDVFPDRRVDDMVDRSPGLRVSGAVDLRGKCRQVDAAVGTLDVRTEQRLQRLKHRMPMHVKRLRDIVRPVRCKLTFLREDIQHAGFPRTDAPDYSDDH